jgi:hypothetical protein
VYSRVLDGKTLTFGVSGKLWNNALVLYDRETDSLWSHVTGEAIRGPLQGKRLTMLSATPRISWEKWRRLHPDTAALSIGGREDAPLDSYARYHAAPEQTGLFPVRRPDPRARPKEMVLGLAIGRGSKAYRHASLRKQPLVQDRVGGTPVLIWYDADSGATAVYKKPSGSDIRLEGDTLVGAGGAWQAATGKAVGKGPDVTALPHTNAYWFGWIAFYPHSDLYP